MMSSVRKPSTCEIIDKSVNQIVPPEILWRYNYIHQTPLSSSRVEGGSGC